jgi:hypothetical protein
LIENGQGRVVEEAVINLQRNATAMEWQPKGRVLAVGNQQGESLLTFI